MVDHDKLMCAGHWRMVPKPLQRAVSRTWRNGAGMGTTEHYAAIKAAVRSVVRG